MGATQGHLSHDCEECKLVSLYQGVLMMKSLTENYRKVNFMLEDEKLDLKILISQNFVTFSK